MGKSAAAIRAASLIAGLVIASAARASTPAPLLGIVDLHVHVGCIGSGGSECHVDPRLRASYKFPLYLEAFGVTEEELERDGDALVVRRLAERVGRSQEVGTAVVLALDGVVDRGGRLDLGRTQLYVPNEFVAAEVAKYPNLRFGASVNPHRADALSRLDAAKRAGALLVKWIPAIMDIDPADTRLEAFYDRLVALGLPLLTHTGAERAFGGAHDAYGDPRRLALPLRRGVTVIAAHLATTGTSEGEENFDRLLPMLVACPTLYGDISSLTQVNKLGYLVSALEQPAIVRKLVYGSDWPLQFFPLVSPWYQIGEVSVRELWAIRRIENPWDRDVALKRAMGVPAAVFERTRALLQPRASPPGGAAFNPPRVDCTRP